MEQLALGFVTSQFPGQMVCGFFDQKVEKGGDSEDTAQELRGALPAAFAASCVIKLAGDIAPHRCILDLEPTALALSLGCIQCGEYIGKN